MNKLLISIALGATIVSTAAAAQDQRGNGLGWDRQVTRQQAQQMADTMFQRFDLNHDGVVTVQEAQKASEEMGAYSDRAGRMLSRIFGTAQSVTLQQFEAQSLARFDREDLNHDGVVTPDEREQARAARRAQRPDDSGGQ